MKLKPNQPKNSNLTLTSNSNRLLRQGFLFPVR